MGLVRRALLLWALVACGGEPRAIVTPPRSGAATATVSMPHQPARWVIKSPESSVSDSLDLGQAGVLYVGDHGRREIVRGDVATDAPTLAPDTLVAIMKVDAKRFAFITGNADFYVADGPLGAFAGVRKGPPGPTQESKIQSLAVGRSAALVVTADHRLLRTSDFGQTWAAVDYALGAKPYGHPSSVNLDREGNGVLVHLPQRVFVTHDDGATWIAVSSPSSGARRCLGRSKEGLFVEGFDAKLAKLEGNVLVPTGDAPKDLAAPLPPPVEGQKDLQTLVLAGDQVVELRAQPGGDQSDHDDVLVRTTRIGEKPGPFALVPALASKKHSDGPSWDNGRVSAWGSRLVYVRPDVNADADRHTSTLMRSDDAGRTWKTESTLEGDEPLNHRIVAAGPRGWTYIAPLCGNESKCTHAKLRLADASSFEDLMFTETFQAMSFTFDERHDKVYALAEQGRERKIYESSLTHNKFSRLSMAVPTSGPWSESVLAVDDEGTLRVFTPEQRDAYGVLRRDVAGKDGPTLVLPRAMQLDMHGLSTMAFAGPRGVLFSGDSSGWETADGGETWERVASNGTWEAQCSDAGCVSPEMQRIGWDLPRPESRDIERVTATRELPNLREDDEPTDDSNRMPAPPPMSFVCKRAGNDTQLDVVPYMGSPLANGDGAWFGAGGWVSEKDRVRVTAGGRGIIKRFTLLEQVTPPSGLKQQLKTAYVPGGFMAARFTYKPDPTSPMMGGSAIDVEIGWFSLATHQPHRGTIRNLAEFDLKISSNFLLTSGDQAIVEGGLLFRPAEAAPLFFVHDDGKVERLSVPAHTTVDGATHTGTTWLLHTTDRLSTSRLDWSTDAGKTWQQRTWALTDDERWGARLESDGQSWLRVGRGQDTIVFPLTLPLPTDPPAPLRWDLTSLDRICDARAPSSPTFGVSTRDTGQASTVQVTEDGQILSTLSRVGRLSAGEPSCTFGYALWRNNGEQNMFLYGASGSSAWWGWSFRTDKATIAHPVTCVRQ